MTSLSYGLTRDISVPIRKLQHKGDEKMNSRSRVMQALNHHCGATRGLIPDLIETGFDILNQVQVSANGMDTKELKAEFGRDSVFWGGGVDTQHILPFGKPQEVVDEVKRRIDDLATGGGFVFAAVHNIQAFVPPENIVAAFDTALEYGKRH